MYIHLQYPTEEEKKTQEEEEMKPIFPFLSTGTVLDLVPNQGCHMHETKTPMPRASEREEGKRGRGREVLNYYY